MTQPSPTPVPDHGTGWGLLLLFINLYGMVALLGFGTVVAIALNHFDRRIPSPVQYLLAAVLLGALGLSGFIVLVAATAQRYDVVALMFLIVFLPPTLVVIRSRGTVRGRSAIFARAAMAWSLPFLVGFGMIGFVGTRLGGLSPAVTGLVAVIIVVAGTMFVEHLPLVPNFDGNQSSL